jgi:hypothetical protein
MAQPLKRLMLATIETIMEGINKEPWTAFINNGFDFTAVMFNHKLLVDQIQDAAKHPDILQKLEDEIDSKFGQQHPKVRQIFKLVWAALIFKVNTIIEISKIVKEEETTNKKLGI